MTWILQRRPKSVSVWVSVWVSVSSDSSKLVIQAISLKDKESAFDSQLSSVSMEIKRLSVWTSFESTVCSSLESSEILFYLWDNHSIVFTSLTANNWRIGLICLIDEIELSIPLTQTSLAFAQHIRDMRTLAIHCHIDDNHRLSAPFNSSSVLSIALDCLP